MEAAGAGRRLNGGFQQRGGGGGDNLKSTPKAAIWSGLATALRVARALSDRLSGQGATDMLLNLI